MKLSVVIPVYNEEKTIYQILLKIDSIKDINKEVIVIDDGSSDNTRQILEIKCKNLFDKKIFFDKNKGKGFACKEGIKIATGDIIIIQDADLEYNPYNYNRLIEPIINNKAKVVYGSRIITGGIRKRPKKLMNLLSTIANYFLTWVSNLLNKQNLTDAHTCYKVFTKDVIKNIKLVENGFSFCPEVTAKISKKNIKILEVPIDYIGRSHKEGKKIQILDGLKALFAIIKYNF